MLLLVTASMVLCPFLFDPGRTTDGSIRSVCVLSTQLYVARCHDGIGHWISATT